MPYIYGKITRQIHKTALGAEHSLKWSYESNIEAVVTELRENGYKIVGLEQMPGATTLEDYSPSAKIAIMLGNEVEGIDKAALKICDEYIEIPMKGAKESLNVVIAAAIVLYRLVNN
jgi:tRNA G18 (ribose-2'-O)-methylase SpoU